MSLSQQLQQPHRPSIHVGEMAVGKVNSQLLNNMALSYDTALALADEGFKLIKVSLIEASPTIQIEYSGKCQHFTSALKKRGCNEHGHYQLNATILNGCQVIWLNHRLNQRRN